MHGSEGRELELQAENDQKATQNRNITRGGRCAIQSDAYSFTEAALEAQIARTTAQKVTALPVMTRSLTQPKIGKAIPLSVLANRNSTNVSSVTGVKKRGRPRKTATIPEDSLETTPAIQEEFSLVLHQVVLGLPIFVGLVGRHFQFCVAHDLERV